MTITITESGLAFGPYEETDIFHIENSDMLKTLRVGVEDGIKTVEFILWWNNKDVLFVEAKSSSPQPGNQEDFGGFIKEIALKFVHSLEVFFSAVLKRCTDPSNEFPKHFNAATCSEWGIEFILVIKGHKTEWLPPIHAALNRELVRQIKIGRLRPIAVLNDGLARQRHLIQ